MISLGIESSAHTFGIGITNEKCELLANEKHSFTSNEGGIIPREVADHHFNYANEVLVNALQKANLEMKDIDIISFTQGPGIGNCLKVGAIFARTLSLKYKKPLVATNHAIAHIEIGKALTGAKNPLVIYISGGNTQIIAFDAGKYRVFGETLDVGVGNLLDSFGREIGIGFPAGPKIDEMYFQGKKLIELPYSVKGMDLVFSGLLTAATNKIGKESKEDLCYSLMHNAFAMIAEVSERALAHTQKNELLMVGGVACSKAAQQMIKEMCEERKTKFFVAPNSVNVDNGFMTAWLGLIMYKKGIKTKIEDSAVIQKFRVDQVEAKWVKN